MTSAKITNPDAIRDFRMRVVAFKEICESALSGSAAELSRVRDWLRIDQQAFWKKQLIKREEVYQQARLKWLEAEGETAGAMNKRGPAKPSSIEERVLMDRARRQRDEAEQKLALVKRWILRIDQDGEPLVNACQNHDFALREDCTKAIVQLDRLEEQVHAYLAVPTAELRLSGMPGGEALPAAGAVATDAVASTEPAPAPSGEPPSAPPAPHPTPSAEADHA